jgi:hypothetical protein
MTRKQKPASWRDWLTFPKNFSYDIDTPIEDVIQALVELEKERSFFKATSQDISVIPAGDDYQFRFRMRQQSNVTALAQGALWEDETGSHIEGEARMSSWMITLALLFIIPWAFFFATMSRMSLDILQLGLLALGINLYIDWRARQRVIDEIEKAVGKAMLNSHLQKRKRSAALELEDSDIDIQSSVTIRKNQR